MGRKDISATKEKVMVKRVDEKRKEEDSLNYEFKTVKEFNDLLNNGAIDSKNLKIKAFNVKLNWAKQNLPEEILSKFTTEDVVKFYKHLQEKAENKTFSLKKEAATVVKLSDAEKNEFLSKNIVPHFDSEEEGVATILDAKMIDGFYANLQKELSKKLTQQLNIKLSEEDYAVLQQMNEDLYAGEATLSMIARVLIKREIKKYKSK